MSFDTFEFDVSNVNELWDEIEAILTLPESPTLIELDNTLRMFICLLSRYHDAYLHSLPDLQSAVNQLLGSDLFRYHSERMNGIIMKQAEDDTNPHILFVIYHVLLLYGSRHPSLFRSQRKWRRLLTSLVDVVSIECDETLFYHGQPVIEARLRLPATMLLYEVCRVQKLGPAEMDDFDDAFINHLFDLVEITRDQQDEELNYAVIKLIIALNEQFMVSSISSSRPQGDLHSSTLVPASATSTTSSQPSPTTRHHHRAHSNSHPPFPSQQCNSSQATRSATDKEIKEKEHEGKKKNRVLSVLMRRLDSSKTFGENIVFMLNRTSNTTEGLCIQLLILKVLYLLFTTAGTYEYFYTNDLRVLLDVFIRELVDIPDESQALRHTYLRVLHPLLTNTQLRSQPYKRPQIRLVLLSLIANEHLRDINPTTKRLVQRCLDADWNEASEPQGLSTSLQSTQSVSALTRQPSTKKEMPNGRGRSHSVENLPQVQKSHLNGVLSNSHNGSTMSLNDVAEALPSARHKHRAMRHLSEASDSAMSDTGSGQGDWVNEDVLQSSPTHLHPSHARLPNSPSDGRRRPPAVPDRSHKPSPRPRMPARPSFEVARPDKVLRPTSPSGHSHNSSSHHDRLVHNLHPQVHQHHQHRQSHGVGYAALAHAKSDASSRGGSEAGSDSLFKLSLDAPEVESEVIAGPGKGQKGRRIVAEGWTTFA